METTLSVLVGIGLSAACGLRVFVPILIASLASRAGWLQLSSGFDWMASDVALIAFSIAALLEIVAYYVPWLDNALDSLASPAAVVAGTLVTASMVVDVSPFLKWTLALIAGGGVAGLVQGGSVVTRGLSTASTAGLANPVVATLELAGSILTSLLAVFVPVLVVALLVLVCLAAVPLWVRRRRRLAPANPGESAEGS